MASGNRIKEDLPQVISYKTLRKAVGILGVSFPIVLVIGTITDGGYNEIQISISEYYHTNMQQIFIGILCAIAFFFFAYKGHTKQGNLDSLLGDMACLFALGVAFFPAIPTESHSFGIFDPHSGVFTDSSDVAARNQLIASIHFTSAVLLFLTLSFFSLILFTRHDGNPTPEKKDRNKVYKACGYTMIGCLVLLGVYFVIFSDGYPQIDKLKPVFWLETIMLWAFGLSWLVKGEVILGDKKRTTNGLKV